MAIFPFKLVPTGATLQFAWTAAKVHSVGADHAEFSHESIK